jgi:hypothetical protein
MIDSDHWNLHCDARLPEALRQQYAGHSNGV